LITDGMSWNRQIPLADDKIRINPLTRCCRHVLMADPDIRIGIVVFATV